MHISRLFILLLALAVIIPACGKKSTDEELVRKAVDRAVRNVEEKDVSAFMKLVSKDYRDNEGNDYNGVKGILVYELLRKERVRVFVRSLAVEVKGDEALIDARVALVRGMDAEGVKDIIPENAEAMRFNVVFRKEGGDWKAVNASWTHLGATGLL
ncbi:MAG: hypothetical protein HY893_10230 [Deltaproteobacteria bacterium]|nr:hypothetical protein [Deltaproteobacteria bacterium]